MDDRIVLKKTNSNKDRQNFKFIFNLDDIENAGTKLIKDTGCKNFAVFIMIESHFEAMY